METSRGGRLERAFYLVALASLCCLILIVAGSFFIPLALGAFFAVLLTAPAAWIERRGWGRLTGAVLPVLALFGILSALFLLALGQIRAIGRSLEDAEDRIRQLLDRADEAARKNLDIETSVFGEINGEGVVDLLRTYGTDLAFFLGGLAGSLFAFMIVPVFIVFFLLYRAHLFEFLTRAFRHTPREIVERRALGAQRVIQNYLIGLCKVVAILAVINSLVLSLIGLEHAIFFGVFAALLNVIPYLGPILGSIFPVLFALFTGDDLYLPFLILAAFIVIQSLESYILTPNIIGRNVRLNPLAALTGIFAGGLMWGVVGMVLAIPALSIAMQLLRLSERTEPYGFLLGAPSRKSTSHPKHHERKTAS